MEATVRFKKASLREQPVPSRRNAGEHFQPGRALDRNPKLNFIEIGPRIISESPEENINSIDISGLRVALEFSQESCGHALICSTF